MEKLLCPKCNNTIVVKNGFQKGKQRYKCKDCGKRFQLDYTYQAYKPEIDKLISTLLKESCGVRSIGRILHISSKTVLSRMLKISKQIKIPYFNKFGCKFEVDEMFIRIGNKDIRNYLTYAIEQKTKHVVGFIVGSRNTENLKSVIYKVLLLHPTRIYTDGLNMYPSLIPQRNSQAFSILYK